MDLNLVLDEPPPLDPAWIEHEKTAGLLRPQPVFANAIDRQAIYSKACKERNSLMLQGRDKNLTPGLTTLDSEITCSGGHNIKIRAYTLASPVNENGDAGQISSNRDLVIYYHGGGLRVGDLDSEDLSCRRICKQASVKVVSVDYRLLPQHSPQIPLNDAYDAFAKITEDLPMLERVILVGSSSGGQLAAQVSQRVRSAGSRHSTLIKGVLLRCPVTVNAATGGKHITQRFRDMHRSFSSPFETSLLKMDEDAAREMTPNLPLEAETFHELPRTFIQVCTNDIYYSDGICYAAALQQVGIKVKVDIVEGWPHTFWLKAPHLDRALQAELDMIGGINWLLNYEERQR